MAAHAPKLFVISLVYVVALTAIMELQVRLPGTGRAYNLFLEQLQAGAEPSFSLFLNNLRPYWFVSAVVLWFAGSVVRVSFMSRCLGTARSAFCSGGSGSSNIKFFSRVLAILAISTVLTALWSTLFVFPGIAAHYRYRQAYYILLDDKGKSAMLCIRESKLIMRGNKFDLFLLDFSFFGWSALNILVAVIAPVPFIFPILGVGLSPYVGLSRAAFYDFILGRLTA